MNGQKVILSRQMYGHTLEMAKMFYVFSDINSINKKLKEYTFDKNSKGVIDTIFIGTKQRFNVSFEETVVTPTNVLNGKNVIVCFSGGKDSTAAAIQMRNSGYNVYLYFVQGINKSYPNEVEQAKKIASYLNMPLTIEKVMLKGTTTFHDNPVKNQLIASMALDYGVTNNIGTTICFGDFTSDNVENSSFLEAWSDTQEMWREHKKFVRSYIPSYDIIIPFKNYIETIDIISKERKLLDMVQGCVLPNRFRGMTKKLNENKYSIELLPNRCGSCWKCCVEYIHLADMEIVEYNRDFYKHCLDFLKIKMDVLHSDVIGRDYETIYNTFLFGEYKESKFYKDIK